VRERITWDVYKFLDQPVVSNPTEGPLYVQEDGDSAVPQIGMSGGCLCETPESELLRWEEVVNVEDIF
jgi:hypothetical protein